MRPSVAGAVLLESELNGLVTLGVNKHKADVDKLVAWPSTHPGLLPFFFCHVPLHWRSWLFRVEVWPNCDGTFRVSIHSAFRLEAARQTKSIDTPVDNLLPPKISGFSKGWFTSWHRPIIHVRQMRTHLAMLWEWARGQPKRRAALNPLLGLNGFVFFSGYPFSGCCFRKSSLDIHYSGTLTHTQILPTETVTPSIQVPWFL